MRCATIFGLSMLVLVCLRVEVSAQLDKQRFDELMNRVVPAETTQQIDWLPDLISAQKVALDQKKPMFIWSMDGHPLGCT